ncbi:hypothetical protein [Geothrix sp. 21YS21S-4]|uniref:hypothetical protein n=1 Tax=Geothrix sp. 21YS21S-4 TaxID=3068889 RepID=UPI0027BA4CA8|nr:hypothetical protein [Geothrix sp. 21YS21S-4]
MPAPGSPLQRLLLARQLVREKGLSKADLALLEDLLREGAGDLEPLFGTAPAETEGAGESPVQADLRRHFGLFLAFLHHLSPARLEEAQAALGSVVQRGLEDLRQRAEAAQRELVRGLGQPPWVEDLLDLLASLGRMGEASLDGGDRWTAFVAERREAFRRILSALEGTEAGAAAVEQLNARMKAFNRAIRGQGRPEEALGRLSEQLEACLPQEIRAQLHPLLLLQHVGANLRMSLSRFAGKDFPWSAVEQVRGSLRWVWEHLGWTLPRVDPPLLRKRLPPRLRQALVPLRETDPAAFSITARALAAHASLLGLLEFPEASPAQAIPALFVMEAELARLAARASDPDRSALLDPARAETSRLRAYLRQAALSFRQDGETLRGLRQEILAAPTAEEEARILAHLRGLLANHQKQLMGELVGIFSQEAQDGLFPGAPSPMEEGERLRVRVQRLWDQIPALHGQLLLHLELRDWPRLALGLAQAHRQLLAFRQSPEFALMRRPDREEAERFVQELGWVLEAPQDVPKALREGMDSLAEAMRFLELFLLRVNARVPLIRQDLDVAQQALGIIHDFARGPEGTERTRLVHKLIQTAKRLGGRDPQALALLKRWVRAERSQREDPAPALDQLAAHLRHLTLRLEAALG